MFKELKEEILKELESYHPITGAEEFYCHYLLVEARVLKREDLDVFSKDLSGIIGDPHVSYSFQMFLKKLISLIREKEKIE